MVQQNRIMIVKVFCSVGEDPFQIDSRQPDQRYMQQYCEEYHQKRSTPVRRCHSGALLLLKQTVVLDISCKAEPVVILAMRFKSRIADPHQQIEVLILICC